MKAFHRSLVFILLVIGSSISWASDKKGVGLADLHASERITALNIAWYYTWKPQPIQGAPPEKFVPMLWGGYRYKREYAELKARAKLPVLLAINEPDRVDQAKMSVDQVVRLWSEISALADKVGSPATAGVLGPWFDRFYRIAQARGLKMDFMAVHLYVPPNADKFLKDIDAVYEKYRLPIWITEFGVADWSAKAPGTNQYTEEQVLAFMKQVLPELEKRPYVVRYAWYGAGKRISEAVRSSRLFNKKGELTPLGRYYAEFTWPPQVGRNIGNNEQVDVR